MTEPKSSDSRRDRALRESAALFARRGVANTTMRQIGEATDMLPGSLYHHFASKDAIVAELLERFMSDIARRIRAVASVPRTPLDTLAAMVTEVLMIIADHPDETTMYQDDLKYLHEHGLLEEVEKVAEEVHDVWIDVLRTGVAAGDLRTDLAPEFLYRPMRDALWASHAWPGRGDVSTEELSRAMFSLFVDGNRARD